MGWFTQILTTIVAEIRPGLYHIFIWLGPALSPSPSLPSLHAHTCVGTLPPLGTNVTMPSHSSH